MTADSEAQVEKGDRLRPGIVAVVLTVLMLTLPYSLVVSYFEGWYGWRVNVMALFWGIRFLSNTIPPFRIDMQPQLAYSFMLFGWLKLYFIHQTYKCYRERVTRKRALIVGIVSEMQLFAWYGLSILRSTGYSGVFFLTPIPLLLLFGLLILFAKRPPVSDHSKPSTKSRTLPFAERMFCTDVVIDDYEGVQCQARRGLQSL